MKKLKAISVKFIQYIGALAALLLLPIIYSGEAAKSVEISVLLSGITVFCIYAIFKIIFGKERSFENIQGIKSGGLMYFIVLCALAGVFIRTVAMMLLNVDILCNEALLCYGYYIVFLIMIYAVSKLCWSHKAGVFSAVFYTVWCVFDVLPVVENVNAEKSMINILKYYGGAALVFLAFMFLLLSLKNPLFKRSAVLIFMSGAAAFSGMLLIMQSVVAIAAIACALLVIKPSFKYNSKSKMIKKRYCSMHYVLYFVLGIIAAAALLAAAVYVSGLKSLVPNYVIYLHEYVSVKTLFVNAETVISAMWSGVYFERNNFVSYINIILYIFAVAAAALGCRNAAKISNRYCLCMILYPVLLTVLGVFQNIDSHLYAVPALPCFITLAGGGITESFQYVLCNNGGFVDRMNDAEYDLPEDSRDEIKNKYALPDEWDTMQVVALFGSSDDESDSDNGDTEFVETDEQEEDMAEDSVVSGEMLTDMLDSLYGHTSSEKDGDDGDGVDFFRK